jgi:hypothetical protein
MQARDLSYSMEVPYFFIDEISLKIKTQNQKLKNEVIFEGF